MLHKRCNFLRQFSRKSRKKYSTPYITRKQKHPITNGTDGNVFRLTSSRNGKVTESHPFLSPLLFSDGYSHLSECHTFSLLCVSGSFVSPWYLRGLAHSWGICGGLHFHHRYAVELCMYNPWSHTIRKSTSARVRSGRMCGVSFGSSLNLGNRSDE